MPAADTDSDNAGLPTTTDVRRTLKVVRMYITMLTEVSIHFGLPTNRLDTNLHQVANALGQTVVIISLPGRTQVVSKDPATGEEETTIIEGEGHCSLSAASQVLAIARDVMRGQSPEEGTRRLKRLMHTPPKYNTYWLCLFSFFCSACFSILEFGGSPIDSLLAGFLSAVLRLVTLKTHKLEVSGIVFE
jgi:uncharacterized membrane protein YjjP (DUF1212 family)